MYKDRFTGKLHTHFRDYDPIHARWLSQDPAGYMDGLNLYNAYMGVNGVDYLGLGLVGDPAEQHFRSIRELEHGDNPVARREAAMRVADAVNSGQLRHTYGAGAEVAIAKSALGEGTTDQEAYNAVVKGYKQGMKHHSESMVQYSLTGRALIKGYHAALQAWDTVGLALGIYQLGGLGLRASLKILSKLTGSKKLPLSVLKYNNFVKDKGAELFRNKPGWNPPANGDRLLATGPKISLEGSALKKTGELIRHPFVDGGTHLTTTDILDFYRGRGSRTYGGDCLFLAPKGQIDGLLAKGLSRSEIEVALGLRKGTLSGGKLVRIDVDNPFKRGLRLPTEGIPGLFRPGVGLTTGNLNEGVIDAVKIGSRGVRKSVVRGC